MNEMVHDLRAIAENNNIAVLFVNQIYNKPDDLFGADPDIPYGGNIIGHGMPYRFQLMKPGRFHMMRIKKSPYQANDDCVFDITADGLVDPPPKVKK
jgi:RecA/RadA recombinase